ncbi:unnamed protein product [Dovyalis caffra]|uniref:Uncharacterized protein n=1 Tax=Dovyalis caffra TaxID=77055 RepID=A0AAV1SBP0_9ROSI|nr:unnamed protein product [Dovyalis caffra]
MLPYSNFFKDELKHIQIQLSLGEDEDVNNSDYVEEGLAQAGEMSYAGKQKWGQAQPFERTGGVGAIADVPGLFRVLTTKNKEVHFVCDGGLEMAELWGRLSIAEGRVDMNCWILFRKSICIDVQNTSSRSRLLDFMLNLKSSNLIFAFLSTLEIGLGSVPDGKQCHFWTNSTERFLCSHFAIAI